MTDLEKIEHLTNALDHARRVFNIMKNATKEEFAEMRAIARREADVARTALDQAKGESSGQAWMLRIVRADDGRKMEKNFGNDVRMARQAFNQVHSTSEANWDGETVSCKAAELFTPKGEVDARWSL